MLCRHCALPRSLRGLGGHCGRLGRSHAAGRCLSTAAATLPSKEAVQRWLEGREWLLADPSVQGTPVRQERGASFLILRDDLTHPLMGGNKLRKLDGLWPQLARATDVVTCGGLQSMHTLAVAAACAERGKRAHLLVRGEAPAVPTGPHLYARMLAHAVVYVSRAEYADREAMFDAYLGRLRRERRRGGGSEAGSSSGSSGPAAAQGGPAAAGPGSSEAGPGSSSSGDSAAAGDGIAAIPEGAAGAGAMLGLVRQVAWLAGSPASPLQPASRGGQRCHLVVDSGTGATATGLALGAALLDLPWRVTGVMLAGERAYYEQQQQALTQAFAAAEHGALLAASEGTAEAAAGAPAALEGRLQQAVADRLRWAPRRTPRKFGRVCEGDVAACRAVAQRHGILLDPMWNLAAWEAACDLATQGAACGLGDDGGGNSDGGDGSGAGEVVAMLHTGGMLGLNGLAQRFPDQF